MVPQVEISNAQNRSKSTYEVQRLQWKLKLEFDLYSVFAIGYYATESSNQLRRRLFCLDS